MANRVLNEAERIKANALLHEIRQKLLQLSNGEPTLLFAYRRKIAKELTYDERGSPTHRKLLKAKKAGLQQGKCASCADALPDKYAVLDRFNAADGYTEANTQLICPACDTKIQQSRGYA